MGGWENPCCPFTRNPQTAVQKTSFHLQRAGEVGKNKNDLCAVRKFLICSENRQNPIEKTSHISPNIFIYTSLVGINKLKYKKQVFCIKNIFTCASFATCPESDRSIDGSRLKLVDLTRSRGGSVDPKKWI